MDCCLCSLGEFRIFPRPTEFSKYHTSFLPPPWPPRLPLKSTQEVVPFGVALARLASVFWRIWKRFLRICARLSTLPKLPFGRSSAGQGEMPSRGSLFSDMHSNREGVALPLCVGASGCARARATQDCRDTHWNSSTSGTPISHPDAPVSVRCL